MKILLSEAHSWVTPSRSAIYDDAKKGVLSTELHRNGRWKVVDVAELQRVYGKVTDPNESPKDSEINPSGRHPDTEKLIQSYQAQIQQLTTQLERSHSREQHLIERLKDEQQKTRMLLPQPAEKRTPRLLRLLGIAKP